MCYLQLKSTNSDEQNKENVANTNNKNPIISAALSEKEMASTVDDIAMKSPIAAAANKILVGLDEKARTPVKRFEPKSGKPKKDKWILSDKTGTYTIFLCYLIKLMVTITL